VLRIIGGCASTSWLGCALNKWLVSTQLTDARPQEGSDGMAQQVLHYAKSYRPFELFVNENYKL